jgi:hypothetical protein
MQATQNTSVGYGLRTCGTEYTIKNQITPTKDSKYYSENKRNHVCNLAFQPSSNLTPYLFESSLCKQMPLDS